jgi:prepilin-type N-terminal cleavage/methylation domain-containing protein
MKTRKGFSLFEIVAVLAVVSLIGFLGYVAYTRFQGQVANNKPATQQVATPNKVDDITVESAPVIKQTTDLDSAKTTLDSINLDSSTEDGQLDKLAKEMN